MGIFADMRKVNRDFEEAMKSMNAIGRPINTPEKFVKPRSSYSYWEKGEKITVKSRKFTV